MVAIVEQRDVPALRQRGEKLQQGTGPLGELEAEDALALHALCLAADHVADVQLGQFVVAHVENGIAVLGQQREDLSLVLAA